MVVGRYAPSPTGALHLGNLRTALASYCFTRAHGGRFLLRIEDIDQPRVRSGSEKKQISDLKLLGIEWDEEPLRQSERNTIYQEQFEKLKSSSRIYPCFCSRKDIQKALSAPHREDNIHGYPGTCAGISEAKALVRINSGEQHSWRLRVGNDPIELADGFHGSIHVNLSVDGGDFVIKRADGLFGYQFVCAVDDALSGVTEVLRGDDLLDSAARQQCVLKALELQVPKYYHIPLMLNKNGERLSKRNGDDDLSSFMGKGYSPETVRDYLAYTLGQSKLGETMTMETLEREFQIERIPRSNVNYIPSELNAYPKQPYPENS